MNLKAFQILLIFISIVIFSTVSGQHFDHMVSELEDLEPIEKDSLITAFISEAGGLPLVEMDTAIFMVRSSGSPPRILGDFNGFLNPRYIKDNSEGDMNQIPETNWYFLKYPLAADARIFYQFKIDSSVFNDPLNVNLGYRFNLINSELRMPEFKVAPELINNQSIASGSVGPIEFVSQTLGHQRNVQIYLPPGYEKGSSSYPSIYFHDGSFYTEWGRVPQILDYLIGEGTIPPVIGIFDDPEVRGKEYRGDPDYIRYIDKELIPYVDSNYRTLAQPQHRAVVGGSRGGLSSLILSHTMDQFSKCGVFSPAIHPREMSDFTNFLNTANTRPQQVIIVAAIYDRVWYQDAVTLKRYFERTPTKFQYHEISEGHNLQSWIPQLDTILQAFFPASSP